MKQRLVYVAGAYRSPTENGVLMNILTARDAAVKLWQAGFAVVCPHMNTALMGGTVPDSAFLAGDLTILRRCDAVYMLPGWEKSTGARGEHDDAVKHGIPVFESLEAVVSMGATY